MTHTYITALDFNALSSPVTTIDLRTGIEVAAEYIDNTVSLPVQSLDVQSFETALANANHADGPVYLLCQSGKRAEMAASKLNKQTKFELVIIEGGLNALKLSGAQVHTGKKNIISLERQVRITAGVLVLIATLLGFSLSPVFFAVSGFIGAGLAFAGITDTCAMGMLIAKMPWNNVNKA